MEHPRNRAQKRVGVFPCPPPRRALEGTRGTLRGLRPLLAPQRREVGRGPARRRGGRLPPLGVGVVGGMDEGGGAESRAGLQGGQAPERPLILGAWHVQGRVTKHSWKGSRTFFDVVRRRPVVSTGSGRSLRSPRALWHSSLPLFPMRGRG